MCRSRSQSSQTYSSCFLTPIPSLDTVHGMGPETCSYAAITKDLGEGTYDKTFVNLRYCYAGTMIHAEDTVSFVICESENETDPSKSNWTPKHTIVSNEREESVIRSYRIRTTMK